MVPNSVTSPPIREANDIGISSDDGDVPVRLASCSAIGIRIASAPTFFDTHRQQQRGAHQHRHLDPRGGEPRQDRAHDPFDRARTRDGLRHDQGGGHDHHDLVGKPLEGVPGRHDAHGDTCQQPAECDQVVGQRADHEHRDDAENDAEGEALVECHASASPVMRGAKGGNKTWSLRRYGARASVSECGVAVSAGGTCVRCARRWSAPATTECLRRLRHTGGGVLVIRDDRDARGPRARRLGASSAISLHRLPAEPTSPIARQR